MEPFKLRAGLVERSFALTLDRGGMRRCWLRGRENLRKRYLVHVAGGNLGPIMRLVAGASAHLTAMTTADTLTGILLVATGTEATMLVVSTETEPHDRKPASSTRWQARDQARNTQSLLSRKVTTGVIATIGGIAQS